jgi:putative PIN family toxin of toxin-antitoxin system
MIVVLDTNIWLSALLSPHGYSGRVLTLVRTGVIQPVSSPRLWAELTRAADYDRVRMPLQRKGIWEDTRRFLASHPMVTLVASVEPTSNWLPKDPDDDWVIQCALTAKADRIRPFAVQPGDRGVVIHRVPFLDECKLVGRNSAIR